MVMTAASMLDITEVALQDPVASVSESTESFYYQDRLLPAGWYVKIGKKQVAETIYEAETSFFSPGGAMLTSQEQSPHKRSL